MKWERKTINEVCNVGDGAHASIKRVSDGFQYLTSKNFKLDGLDLSKVDYISEEDYQKHFKDESKAITKPKSNDVLLSIIGSLGAPYLVNEDDVFGLSSSVSILRPKNEIIEPKFLYYWIKSNEFQSSINNIKSGVAQSFLSLGMIKSLPVIYPTELPTQRKIASILSAYDDLIENNLKRIKLLEVKLMIEYSLLEDDSKNLKEFDFSNFVTFIKGIEPGSSNYISEKSDGTLPFIRVGDLSKRDSDIFVEESKTKGIISNPNDVLISMDGTIGIVRYGIYGCYSSGIRKAVSNGVLNNAFIFCYLSSKKIQGVIYSHSKGSTIQHAGSSISHFKIKLPKEAYLNDFIKFSNPIYDMMNNLLKQNTKLREARDIALPKLMNGQIEV